jgi:hypothetical protein
MPAPLALLALFVTLPFAQAGVATPPATDERPDALICRREVPVGSLIATRKTCLTRAQWAERERIGNETARRMVENNQGRPTGD